MQNILPMISTACRMCAISLSCPPWRLFSANLAQTRRLLLNADIFIR